MKVVKSRMWPPVARAAYSPAAWCFGVVWLAALGVLVARGFTDRAVGAPLILIPLLLFCWLTVLLTVDPPPVAPSLTPRLVLQTAVVLAIASLTGSSAMWAFGVGPSWLDEIPLWSGMFGWLLDLGRGLPYGARAAIVNPVLELGLPSVALLLLGAWWRDLGFGRGHRVGRVLLVWCAPQLVNLLVLALSGGAKPLSLLVVFVRNGFQNGPVEEFLFRGALQTRLSLLLGGGWGLVLSALAFGAWHVGTNAKFETHGDLIGGICAGIAGQAPYGLAFGLIFQRTRNLVAGSVFHMLLDLP